MDNTLTPISEAKYHKLASEYAKLRGQASVLKRAVLDEQAKNATLRDNLRQSETALRRSEQEVDSLGFRNKQLEHRVASLQEEIAVNENRKHEKEKKRIGKSEMLQINEKNKNQSDLLHDALVFEELQKKIMENAHLTSLIDDKERELLLHSERILNLEMTLEKRVTEQNELEKRLRRELEAAQTKNCELETKLVEAVSMLGSEDALSVSGSDNTPLHNMHNNHTLSILSTTMHTSEERISHLEKEVSHWRTQYELIKLNDTFSNNNKENLKQICNNFHATLNDANCSCSSTAAGLSVKPAASEYKSKQYMRENSKEVLSLSVKEHLLYNLFSKKYEDLMKAKYHAESRVKSFETEVEHLQNCLEEATQNIKLKEEQIHNINRALQVIEEDLATTRINYDEQISVLTEQIISLSEQLAACK